MSKNKPAANFILALVELARLRIVGMVLVSCAAGYVLAYRGQFEFLRLFWTLLGTAMLNGGACALNCYLERDADALMPRTLNRPIPAGLVSPATALTYGVGLVIAGFVVLFWQVNMLSSLLGLVAVFVYLDIYTPAKRMTWLNTSIGAIPGAIPPLIGWASATGHIDNGGWILFAMLFFWQHTHFFPIAWLYRDDYARGGFCMLPVLESSGAKTFQLTVLTAMVLLPVSMLLYGTEFVGIAYRWASILMGIILILASCRLKIQPSRSAASMVLLFSLFYLPVIFAAVLIDRFGMQVSNHLLSWLVVFRWT